MRQHKHSKNVCCSYCGDLIIVHQGRRRILNTICDNCLDQMPSSNKGPAVAITASPQLETSEADCVDSLLSIIDKDFKEDFEYTAPDKAFEIKETRIRISTVLKTLSKKEQLVIDLHFEMGYTLEEVGQALSISIRSVKKTEISYLKKLRNFATSEYLRTLY